MFEQKTPTLTKKELKSKSKTRDTSKARAEDLIKKKRPADPSNPLSVMRWPCFNVHKLLPPKFNQARTCRMLVAYLSAVGAALDPEISFAATACTTSATSVPFCINATCTCSKPAVVEKAMKELQQICLQQFGLNNRISSKERARAATHLMPCPPLRRDLVHVLCAKRKRT